MVPKPPIPDAINNVLSAPFRMNAGNPRKNRKNVTQRLCRSVADDPRVYAYVLLTHESRTFVVDGAR